MKTVYTFLLSLALLTTVSCTENNEDDPSAATGIATEEAAEIVGTSLASSSAGLVGMTTETASTSAEVIETNAANLCALEEDSTFNWASQPASAISFNAELSYSYAVSCNEVNLPESIAYDMTYSSSFDGPRMASSNTGGSSWTLTSLNALYTSFELNGTYSRIGTFESKIFRQSTTNATANFVLDGLVLDLPTESIISGTATYTLAGTGPQGNPYNFEGTVTFIGQGKATVVVQGRSFMVDLESGEITEL
ncbi:MAG: hypothetical protein AAF388_19235 [Bacteroidota bacterium]